jgi:predicted flap endonuclease-1-like 5' DNA nuclease
MTNILEVEGIGDTYAEKLKVVGITTTEELLEIGATPKGRQELVEKTGISDKLILKWVNRVDLFRVKGIGEQYSDLLEVAGVDTVVELAQRRADHLFKKMDEVNATKKLVRRLPTQAQVQDWIEQAKKLPRKVKY